ncbi:Dihydrofolate reductase [Baekduia alba]|uniref:dihydrofolate reductase n=1 Tax=Baekduia alba TaxID=2997333 RepID=UPI002341B3B9|nr:dihydrofolate reductase [Baekduia alba]WCB93786.1 Dihydrofolate reductase [Baekduia alba]
MTVALVVAYARNGVIGRDGGLPWHLPSDMQHFRELTTGGTVLMGRKTYESIPERFRPLPGRRNLVLSRDGSFVAAGTEVFGSLAAALAACEGDCFVIGGGATYEEALPLADEVWATEVDAEVEGDTFFPVLDTTAWREAAAGSAVTENGFSFTIRRYERRA